MRAPFSVVCVSLLAGLTLVACGPSSERPSAVATTIASSVMSTQIAAAPTATLIPTSTPQPASTAIPTIAQTPTATPTATPTETPIPTPEPQAVVVGETLNVREGPGTGYAVLGRLSRNEELEIAGQYSKCSWLQVSSRSQDMSGWIAGGKQYVDLRVPCEEIPAGRFRPVTGYVTALGPANGHGQLTVENGTNNDGVVILTLNEKPVAAAYIRAGDSFTIKDISDGIYYLYFSTGVDWNGDRFVNQASYQRFDDSIPFTTSATTYTIWNVTLHGVVGGTASASDVDESEFPAIGQ